MCLLVVTGHVKRFVNKVVEAIYHTRYLLIGEDLPFVSSVVAELVNPLALVFTDDFSGAPGSLVVPLGGANRSTASVMEISRKPDELHTETVIWRSLHTRIHLMLCALIPKHCNIYINMSLSLALSLEKKIHSTDTK